MKYAASAAGAILATYLTASFIEATAAFWHWTRFERQMTVLAAIVLAFIAVIVTDQLTQPPPQDDAPDGTPDGTPDGAQDRRNG